MNNLGFIGLVGGLAIFLYGMELGRESLQLVAGNRLRNVIARVTENRLFGLGAGVVVTVFLQSSSATSVMLVNFASTGLMTLSQAMTVALGAGVGTTITVQVISFKISHYALLLVAIGYVWTFVTTRRRLIHMGQLVMAFGFIFFGMNLMGQATAPLKDAAVFQQLIGYLGDNPFVALLAATVFTGIVQASAATIGLVISLAIGGTVGLHVALPMVLGANIGTTVTAMLSSLGAPPVGKQVALAHLLYKTCAALIAYLLLEPLTAACEWSSNDIARQIANGHTIFNLAASFVFLPFTGIAAKFLGKWYAPEEEMAAFRPKYLDRRALDAPMLAFGHATREFLHMCDIVNSMLRDCVRVFSEKDTELIAEIEARDDQVDILDREIRMYLARLTQGELSPDQADQELELVTLSTAIENAGDVINKNIMSLGTKYIKKNLSFSDDGWAELRDLHGKVSENFDLALLAFSGRNEGLARKVLRHVENFEAIESELRSAHLRRLHDAVPETFETSAIHMDLITYLVRINQFISRIAEAVLADMERRSRDLDR